MSGISKSKGNQSMTLGWLNHVENLGSTLHFVHDFL